MASLDAVLFDADGVFQRPPIDLAAQLAEALGVAPLRADELIIELFRAEADALTGTRDIFSCVEPVLTRWGIFEGMETFGTLWHQVEVDHSVLSLVEELRSKGMFCGLASNQQSHRARKMSLELGYAQIFDAEFYSCQIGLTKPAEEYFDEIIQRANLKAERTLFVDDRIANVEAAKRVGLCAVQFAPAILDNGGDALRVILKAYGSCM